MKKLIKPAYTVNITAVNNPQDAYVCFALAKQANNIPIEDFELVALIEFIIRTTVDNTINEMFRTSNCVVFEDGRFIHLQAKKVDDVNNKPVAKKPGFFKRMWNKIRRK